MRLENETPYAARLIQLELGDNRLHAAVIVKATFVWDEHGRARPAVEQMPIVDEQLATSFGIFHSDLFLQKQGVDLCVLGTLRRSQPQHTAQVRVSTSTHRHTITVFGDRNWLPSGSSLVASKPRPFTEMPLSYARAYGGTTKYDYETAVCTDNPSGIGYYLSEETAVGGPLPNIEAEDGPYIRQWQDQPRPAGIGPYPQLWGLRAREGVQLPTNESDSLRVLPRLYNNAHPSLVLSTIEEREAIRIDGLRDQPIVVELPAFEPIVEVSVGGRVSEANGKLDGVFVWVDCGHVTLTKRIHFEYELYKEQQRVARLRERAPLRKL